jgi:hypothetical protein
MKKTIPLPGAGASVYTLATAPAVAAPVAGVSSERELTDEELGAMDFNPIPLDQIPDPPTQEQWIEMAKAHATTLGLGRIILTKTKQELMALCRAKDPVDEMRDILSAAEKMLECLETIANRALARLRCAAAAVRVEDAAKRGG